MLTVINDADLYVRYADPARLMGGVRRRRTWRDGLAPPRSGRRRLPERARARGLQQRGARANRGPLERARRRRCDGGGVRGVDAREGHAAGPHPLAAAQGRARTTGLIGLRARIPAALAAQRRRSFRLPRPDRCLDAERVAAGLALESTAIAGSTTWEPWSMPGDAVWAPH